MLHGQNHADVRGRHVHSWHSYNLGDEALILQRQPWQYVDGMAHRIFLGGRHQLVSGSSSFLKLTSNTDVQNPKTISAFMRHKRSFLSDHVWKTLPFQKHGKSTLHHLLDAVVDVSWIMELADEIVSAPNLELFVKLVRLYKTIDANMEAWKTSHAPYLTVDELNVLGCKTSNITDMDIYVAEVMTLYWTACMILHSSLQIAIQHCRWIKEADAIIATLGLGSRNEPRTYVALIAKMVRLFFQPESGDMASKAAAFPMGMSMSYLRDNNLKKSTEYATMLSHFAQSDRGRQLGEFIMGTRPVRVFADRNGV